MSSDPKPESPKFIDGVMKHVSPGTSSSRLPTDSQIGKYLGRIIIDVYEPTDRKMSDGLVYQAYLVGSEDRHAIDQFVRDTVLQFYQRLQRQKPF